MAVESASLAPVSSPLSVVGSGPDLGALDHIEPAPFNDPELVHPGDPRPRIERLGDCIAELSARIQAATYELLVLIRQFDEANGWSTCVSCAHWLSWRTGLAPGAARGHVRVARALGKLPKLSDAMRRGVVSYSKVRAVTRVATPETEQALLDVALCGTAAHVEQVVRGWRRVDRAAEQVEDRVRHAARSLSTWVDDDGMVVVRGRLTPEVGAVLRRALEAACDQAQQADSSRNAAREVEGDTTAADMAEAAIEQVSEGLKPTFAQRQADAIGMLAECALAGGLDRGTAGDRYQVVVHVDAGALAEAPDVPAGTPAAHPAPAHPGSAPAARTRPGSAGLAARGRPMRRSLHPCPGPDPAAPTPAQHLAAAPPAAAPAAGSQTVLDEAGGIHVSQETARRLACDAATVKMQQGAGGEILDVGRRTRTISPALRRALVARDRQCQFPGCHNRRCDAHHLRHWADGGATALDNLVLLCRRHHRAVHEEGFRVTLAAAGGVRFVRPDGRPLPEAPAAPAWSGEPLAPVAARLDREGVAIDPHTATPAWRGERLDVGWAVSLLWRPGTVSAS